ncbi:MAG: hypothetical protein PHV68_07790 [Candidatus Gastranaerophilales bacterium]|nr:hypothetical protein [Candidatus Gastranaerophilales bacterium]
MQINAFYKNQISFGIYSPLKQYAQHCAYCGEEMIDAKDLGDEADKLLQENFDSEYSKKFFKALPPIEQNVLSELEQIKIKNPSLSSKEVIYQSIINSKNFLNNFDKKSFFKQIEQTKNLSNKGQNFIKEIQNPNTDEDREIILLKKLLRHVKTGEQQNKLKNLIVSQYILKNSSSANGLVSKLLSPLVLSVEHIYPDKKLDSPDNPTNYLYVHSYCNGARGSKNFKDFLEKKPEVIPNIQKSLREIDKNANSLHVYAILKEVCNTLKEQSGGKLDIMI